MSPTAPAIRCLTLSASPIYMSSWSHAGFLCKNQRVPNCLLLLLVLELVLADNGCLDEDDPEEGNLQLSEMLQETIP